MELYNSIAERNVSHQCTLNGPIRTPKVIIDEQRKLYKQIKDKEERQAVLEVCPPSGKGTTKPLQPNPRRKDEESQTSMFSELHTIAGPDPATGLAATPELTTDESKQHLAAFSCLEDIPATHEVQDSAETEQTLLDQCRVKVEGYRSKKKHKISTILQKDRTLLFKYLVILFKYHNVVSKNLIRLFNKLKKKTKHKAKHPYYKESM